MSDQHYPVSPTVHRHHSFYWDTSLTPERMQAISDWLGSLDEDHRRMVQELLDDKGDSDAFDAAEAEQ